VPPFQFLLGIYGRVLAGLGTGRGRISFVRRFTHVALTSASSQHRPLSLNFCLMWMRVLIKFPANNGTGSGFGPAKLSTSNVVTT